MKKNVNTGLSGAELERFNRWSEEFKVSSRYCEPLGMQDRHHFDTRFYDIKNRKPVTFYLKFMTIVKSIF